MLFYDILKNNFSIIAQTMVWSGFNSTIGTSSVGNMDSIYNFLFLPIVTFANLNRICFMELNDFKNNIIPFKNMMYRLARRLLKNREDAEDAVQEAFLKLWLKRNELKIEGNLQALCMITVKNLCLDKLKSSGNKIVSLDDDDIIKSSVTPLSQLEELDIKSKINKIVNNLPEQQKIIIHLRDIEGLSNDEVAEIVKMNKNAVKVTLSRARTKLKNELNKQFIYIKNEN